MRIYLCEVRRPSPLLLPFPPLPLPLPHVASAAASPLQWQWHAGPSPPSLSRLLTRPTDLPPPLSAHIPLEPRRRSTRDPLVRSRGGDQHAGPGNDVECGAAWSSGRWQHGAARGARRRLGAVGGGAKQQRAVAQSTGRRCRAETRSSRQQPIFLFSKMGITAGSSTSSDGPTHHRRLKSNRDLNQQ